MKLLLKIHEHLAPGGVPMAWRQLVGDKKRFVTAIAGVSFGVVLMLFQLGIFEAFMIMVIRPIEVMRGDVVVISKEFQYIMSAGAFPERRLYQALALPETDSVYPVRMDFMRWRNPENGRISELAIIGVHPQKNPLIIPGIKARKDVLALPNGLLFDELSSPDLGNVSRLMKEHEEVNTEINRRSVVVHGLFRLGQTLAAYGHAIVGVEAFHRLSGRDAQMIQFGMVDIKSEANPEKVVECLNEILPEDVEAITRKEFIRREQRYWQDNTPIGFIVIAGMVIAMFVGAIIVYQILYTDINDHQKEYATLKAMGLGDGFFLKFIIEESLILLFLGFPPGMLMASLLFRVAAAEAGMPAGLTVFGVCSVFCLAAVMCVVAGLFATRRLRAADPADIF